jgi:hypothetical protein
MRQRAHVPRNGQVCSSVASFMKFLNIPSLRTFWGAAAARVVAMRARVEVAVAIRDMILACKNTQPLSTTVFSKPLLNARPSSIPARGICLREMLNPAVDPAPGYALQSVLEVRVPPLAKENRGLAPPAAAQPGPAARSRYTQRKPDPQGVRRKPAQNHEL